MLNMKIGKKLKELLRTRKMTQGELSELTGLRQSDISDWINDKHQPRSESLNKIVATLNVSVADLVDSKPPELSDTDQKLLSLQEEQKKLVLAFFEFLTSQKLKLH